MVRKQRKARTEQLAATCEMWILVSSQAHVTPCTVPYHFLYGTEIHVNICVTKSYFIVNNSALKLTKCTKKTTYIPHIQCISGSMEKLNKLLSPQTVECDIVGGLTVFTSTQTRHIDSITHSHCGLTEVMFIM